jgi:hypothetical protein
LIRSACSFIYLLYLFIYLNKILPGSTTVKYWHEHDSFTVTAPTAPLLFASDRLHESRTGCGRTELDFSILKTLLLAQFIFIIDDDD